jgi:hypothetical protein
LLRAFRADLLHWVHSPARRPSRSRRITFRGRLRELPNRCDSLSLAATGSLSIGSTAPLRPSNHRDSDEHEGATTSVRPHELHVPFAVHVTDA